MRKDRNLPINNVIQQQSRGHSWARQLSRHMRIQSRQMNLIERALIWFKDGDEKRKDLNHKYYPLSVLYTRLLRETYKGKRIQFINVYFKTEKTYELFPKSQKNYLHFYDGDLWYNDVFDFDHFNSLTEEQKRIFIWSRTHEIMAGAARKLGNTELGQANEYAYKAGMERSLVADYKILETEVILFEQAVNASIWYFFEEDGMYSYLLMARDQKEVYRRELAKGALGNEFFLEMYKRITAKQNKIIVEYVRSAQRPPVTILIEPDMLG